VEIVENGEGFGASPKRKLLYFKINGELWSRYRLKDWIMDISCKA